MMSSRARPDGSQDLADRHVLVTGGASGIGAAVGQQSVKHGAVVSVLDREEPSACAWWTQMPASFRGTWLQIDAADLRGLEDALPEVVEDVDGVVPAAGMSLTSGFLDVPTEEWTRTLELNVVGTATTCRVAAAQMVRHRRPGAIVTIASTAARGHVFGLGAAYHASKGAVEAMTRSMAGELGGHGIRVNGVVPGVVPTRMTESILEAVGEEAFAERTMLNHLTTPKDVAEVVVFLLSERAHAVTGVMVPVDGGQLARAGARPSQPQSWSE